MTLVDKNGHYGLSSLYLAEYSLQYCPGSLRTPIPFDDRILIEEVRFMVLTQLHGDLRKKVIHSYNFFFKKISRAGTASKPLRHILLHYLLITTVTKSILL